MKISSEKTLFLIDGSSFLYRAYYGLRPLHTSQGVPVQAVYGFCRMLKKLIDTFNPNHVVLVWDSKGKTARHELFKEYKATRQAAPSDLFEQKDFICEFAQAIGLHQLAQVGVEADDLMYSLAKDWAKKEGNAVIVTSDKDMGQAITEDIILYDAFKEALVDEKAFSEKMGFSVEKTPFYFALVGDSSDNIPGVRGVGKKGALELVSQFKDLKDLYNNLDGVKSTRTRTALAQHKDDAFLSEKLFLLQYHKTSVDEKETQFDNAQWVNARSLFQKLEFKSFLKELGEEKVSQSSGKTVKDYGHALKTITTEGQLKELCARIKEKKCFAYDTETDSLNALNSNLVGVSLCCEEGTAYYVPCGHTTGESQLSLNIVAKHIKDLMEDASIEKIAHHMKFDQLVLSQYEITFAGTFFDTLIAAYLVKEDWQKGGLKDLSGYYLNEAMLNFEQVVTEKKLKHFGQVPLKEATEYAAADALQTFRLYPLFKKMLKEQKMETLFYEIEQPLVQILFEMEKKGIGCDVSVLKELDEVVVKKLHEIKKTILDLLGPEFKDVNLNSSKQVGEILFDYLQLPPQKKQSKTGAYSTDNEVLVTLTKLHPIPGYIAQYRELFKLKSTYIDALPGYINKKDNRIHTTYSQTRVATGRLASSDPNLQNIPADGLGGAVRAAFKPDRGRLFLSADYSQIELRVLAHLSKDEHLVNAFLAGHDIHTETASKLFDVALDKVTKEQRSVGKRINFSILYGLTPYGLSKDLDIPLKDAKVYIDTYFKEYPRVKKWMDIVIENAKQDGYVTTLHGRRRNVPGIYERNKNLFELACRIAVNTVAQGTAAEVMKMGMLAVDKALKKKKLDAHIILQIHDEILLTVASGIEKEVEMVVKEELEHVVKWNLPLIVHTAIGGDWREVK